MFRYAIVAVADGTVYGTDDTAVAEELALCDDYYVIDTQEHVWLVQDVKTQIDKWPHS